MAELPARDKLLKHAARLFAQNGLDGVTVRDICKATGVNVSLVSYHFGGKAGLYRAILEEHFLRVSATLRETLDNGEKTVSREGLTQKIRTIIVLMVETRLVNPEIAMLMQRERLDGLPFSRKIYEKVITPLANDLENLVVSAQKAGLIRKDINARSYFISLIESIFGYFIFQDCKLSIFKDSYRMPQQKDAYIEFMTKLYTEGIFS